MSWVSTSPAFYLGDQLFGLGNGFKGAREYHDYKFSFDGPPTKVKITTIGNDVWLGEGVTVLPGARIADGCVVAARTVVA